MADSIALTGITYEPNQEDEVQVHLFSTGPISEPRIRTAPGVLRFWIPNVQNNPRVDIPGDGEIFRELSLRAGVGDTGVLTLTLARRVRIVRDQVHFEPSSRGGVIHISRRIPPSPQEQEASAGQESEEDVAQLALSENDSDETLEANADQEESGLLNHDATTSSQEGTPLFVEHESEEKDESSMLEGSGNIGLLVFLTLILGGAYALVRFLSKYKKIIPADDINIIASKRVGPRYQLMVVRALGNDHLLAVHKGQTQLISSIKLEQDDTLAESGTRLLDRIHERMEDDQVELSGEEPDEDRFGAKLLSLSTIRHRLDTAIKQEKISNASESDAVAGLLRLRRTAQAKQA